MTAGPQSAERITQTIDGLEGFPWQIRRAPVRVGVMEALVSAEPGFIPGKRETVPGIGFGQERTQLRSDRWTTRVRAVSSARRMRCQMSQSRLYQRTALRQVNVGIAVAVKGLERLIHPR